MIYDLQGNPLNAEGGNVLYGKKYVVTRTGSFEFILNLNETNLPE